VSRSADTEAYLASDPPPECRESCALYWESNECRLVWMRADKIRIQCFCSSSHAALMYIAHVDGMVAVLLVWAEVCVQQTRQADMALHFPLPSLSSKTKPFKLALQCNRSAFDCFVYSKD